MTCVVLAPQSAQSKPEQRIVKYDLRHDQGQAEGLAKKIAPAIFGRRTGQPIELDTANVLRPIRMRPNRQGGISARYRQFYRGIPVWPEQVIAISQNRQIRSRGQIIGGLEQAVPRVDPAFSPSDALQQAKQYAWQHDTEEQGRSAKVMSQETVELIVHVDPSHHARLAYRVSYFSDAPGGGSPSRPHVILDARTGEVITFWQGLTDEKIGFGPGGNTKTGRYEYGVDYGHLDVTLANGQCLMETTQAKTINLNHGVSDTVTAYAFAPFRNTVMEINGAYSPLNDAHYFGLATHGMYQDWYAVPPLSFKLVLRVHYSTNYANAFWNGSTVTFGDGNLKFFPLVSADVVGHEISHGFTEQNSNLIYSGHSGAINESFSDMAGEALTYYLRGSTDFLVGAEIIKTPGAALRYLEDPPRDGRSIGHLRDYTPGLDVHYSCGIYNKVYYLLAHTPGWDARKAFDVFVKANQDYWTPNTEFFSGAEAARDSASDLGYSVEAVEQAFLQVGIDLSQPYVLLIDPDGRNDIATTFYTIRWSDYVRDRDGQIALYYDSDASGQNGTLITSGIREDDETDRYTWNTTGVPRGNYYIYAVLTDGFHDPVISYSPGTVALRDLDVYEPDNNTTTASWIALNTVQEHHSLIPIMDYDYIWFDIPTVPAHVIMRTEGTVGDTHLQLIDRNGRTTLAENEDANNGRFSEIGYTFTTAGVYYLQVRPGMTALSVDDYRLVIQAVSLLPTRTVTRTLTATRTPVLTVTPTPIQSKTTTPTPSAVFSRTATQTPTMTLTFSPTKNNTVITTPISSLTATLTQTLTPASWPHGVNKSTRVFPNPSQGRVTFAWQDVQTENVRIELFNIAGARIGTIQARGMDGQIVWDAQNIAAGIYLYQIVFLKQGRETGRQSGKIALIR